MLNKKGQFGIVIGLLTAFIVVTMMVMLIPGFLSSINMAKGSNNLNCVGYVDSDLSDGNYSYNATLPHDNTIACMGLSMYMPYIVLVILIAVTMGILYNKSGMGQQSQYG